MCLDCDALCDDQGCTVGGAAGCVACKQGYSKQADGSCADTDECALGKCDEGYDCMNIPGSFICSCNNPKKLVDEKCILPKDEL